MTRVTGGKIEAVIYDCDGVMFDSLEANCRFYGEIFARMGLVLDRQDESMMRIIHTYSNREVLKHFFPEQERQDEALNCARSIDYMQLTHLMKMEEGLQETLQKLHGSVRLAVCTNRSKSMDSVLQAFNLDRYFDFVMTASRASYPKPHPDPLNRILHYFGLEADRVLFIGDSAVDAQAASAAGVPFVAYRANLTAIARIDKHQELLELLSEV